MPDEFDEIRHMWDGSEHWVLIRSHHKQTVLTVRFADEGPSLLEMARTRQLLPAYRRLPLGEVKSRLKGRARLEIEPLPPREAEELAAYGRRLGLCVEERNTSRTGYLPFRPEDSMICLIDDDNLAKQVTSAMLGAGVTVIESAQQAPF